ncbi:uncharacterized protein LOC143289795 [Babylonia areolata]|uniref:uncharacterized protein LOC143289795 n=1 Tax=Babylonia areolata TaxID=304850 RepID=UPI003FD159B3
MAAAAPMMMDVPESQRLITLSLGKIAASRGQKGGINLHKNLLVATVLTKARAAYMIQHINAAKQRAAAQQPQPSSSSPSPAVSSSSTCVEMREQQSTASSLSPATSSPSSPSSTPVHHHSSPPSASPSSPVPAAPQSVTPVSASVPEGAAGSCMQVVGVAGESEDKENTPPPCRDATTTPPCSTTSTTLSPECEKRLQGEQDIVAFGGKPALSSRSVSHCGQQQNTTSSSRPDYVSRPSSTCCLLKRRRAMDSDHENVSAPKVRIVEARVSDSTSTPEPMQCDSPQISNLVNIFNTSFAGLSGSGGMVGQSILSSVAAHNKLSDNSHSNSSSGNLTCAKEIKVGGLDSVHQPLVLSV